MVLVLLPRTPPLPVIAVGSGRALSFVVVVEKNNKPGARDTYASRAPSLVMDGVCCVWWWWWWLVGMVQVMWQAGGCSSCSCHRRCFSSPCPGGGGCGCGPGDVASDMALLWLVSSSVTVVDWWWPFVVIVVVVHVPYM
jgi:hypothetical protein